MIESKNDLHIYLQADKARMMRGGVPTFKDWILKNEKWFVRHYLIHLRYVEYYQNCRPKWGVAKKMLSLVPYLYHYIRYKRIGFDLRYKIPPNTVEAGVIVYHTGDMVRVQDTCRIGKNCTLRPGVVFGRKGIQPDPEPVEVGDNCEFGVGARIIGSVKIGNNVTVGANCVITHDIPDNAVVAGIPAKIIRYK